MVMGAETEKMLDEGKRSRADGSRSTHHLCSPKESTSASSAVHASWKPWDLSAPSL